MNKFIMDNLNKYLLIGIGDFSHGNQNIWEHRFDLLKYLLKNTDKKIVIYNEDTEIHSNNIMNVKKKLSYYKSYGIYKGFPYGPLEKYCFRSFDSKIYLEIIKFIRKNIDRIKLVGVANGNLKRDQSMANLILRDLDKNKINLFFGHNSHINNMKIYEKYEDKSEKYRCGYYLKKKLKNKYLIILSTAYKGKNRYDCLCSNDYCDQRIAYKIPKTFSFENKEYKNLEEGFYENFNKKIVVFTACYFKKNNKFILNKHKHVLFFKNTKTLGLIPHK